MKKQVGHFAVFLFWASLTPSIVLAASDGSIGTTSTGTSTVTVTVPDLVRITGMANLALGTWSGAGDLEGNEDVCIYTNKAAATYYVTASGSGAASAFTIASGGNTLAYTVEFNDVSGMVGEISLTTTTKSVQQSGANTSSQTCAGSDNANYHVTFAAAALAAAPSGSYTGTLTILIEPN